MKSREERALLFVDKATKVHKGKYRYFPDKFVDSRTDIPIECPIHGIFEQRPSHHTDGHGCPKCDKDAKRVLVCGKGYNDLYGESNTKAGLLWNSMIRRCYSPKALKRRNTYSDCEVCEDWLIFSNFKRWFDKNYVEGYQLDKDILHKGNRVYSPDSCCFVPLEINTLLTNKKANRGDLPIGVHEKWNRKHTIRGYDAALNGKWIGYFKSVELAFKAYKQAKESRIKEVAQEYYHKGKIAHNVYEALMRYEVEITD